MLYKIIILVNSYIFPLNLYKNIKTNKNIEKIIEEEKDNIIEEEIKKKEFDKNFWLNIAMIVYSK